MFVCACLCVCACVAVYGCVIVVCACVVGCTNFFYACISRAYNGVRCKFLQNESYCRNIVVVSVVNYFTVCNVSQYVYLYY